MGLRIRPSRRILIAIAATLVVLTPIGWLWVRSLIPGDLSPMSMGYADLGGGAAIEHAAHHGGAGRSVAELTGPRGRAPDVNVVVTARKERFDLRGHGSVEGYTLNHTSPGPVIRARQGDLVQVRFVNESVPDGATLHWHGVDVPAAEDGVAGVTQDAVAQGKEHVYRFVVADAGTYWYHSHQVSHEQVRDGLFGALVVSPRQPSGAQDVLAVSHNYDKVRTVNGGSGEQRTDVAAGSTVRVRVINTDNGPMAAWVAGTPYKVVAVDGTDFRGPAQVDGKSVLVTAGGRIDLEFAVPAGGARIALGGGPTTLVVGPPGSTAPTAPEPAERVDLLSYGTPAPLGFDPSKPDRRFEYRIGRRPGFLDGRPGLWWTINGHQYPNTPMFMVAEHDVVRMRISNTSGQVHPMHLHGHHVLVLSRDGVPASGSPWWTDSLNVEDNETYEVAFVADNPGVWMDHCHNLPHAAQGLVTHLMYTGVTTPYRMGGPTANEPE